MEYEATIITLLIGGFAGWIAGALFKSGMGVFGNVILGLLGGWVGSYLFGKLEIHVGGEWVGPIVTATVGSIILMFFISLFNRDR